MSNYTVQRLFTWGAVVSILVFFLSFVLSGFMPPPSPSLTQAEVSAHYQQYANGIRGGMQLMLWSGLFIPPLVAVISAQIKRIQGISSTLVYAQISAGTAGSIFFFLPALFFIVTAYRPDRSPELTYLMNDMSWIMAVLPFQPALIQNVIIGIAVLSDKSPQPIFPRWLGFLNFWVALGFLPTSLLPFFTHGPFAWNGIFVFWLAAVVFGTWFLAMVYTLLKAINREEAEDRVAG